MVARHLKMLHGALKIILGQIRLADPVVGRHGHLVHGKHFIPGAQGLLIVTAVVKAQGFVYLPGVGRGGIGLQVPLDTVYGPDITVLVHRQGGKRVVESRHIQVGHIGPEFKQKLPFRRVHVHISPLGGRINQQIFIHPYIVDILKAIYGFRKHIAAVGLVLFNGIPAFSQGHRIYDSPVIQRHVGKGDRIAVQKPAQLFSGKENCLKLLKRGKICLVHRKESLEFSLLGHLDHAAVNALAHDINISPSVCRHLGRIEGSIPKSRDLGPFQLLQKLPVLVEHKDCLSLAVGHIDRSVRCHIDSLWSLKFLM